MKLMEIWVKTSFLKAASLLIAGECAQAIYYSVYKKFSKGKVILMTYSKAEGSAFMGKLASIITCSVQGPDDFDR